MAAAGAAPAGASRLRRRPVRGLQPRRGPRHRRLRARPTRRAGKALDRPAHQLDRADAGVDDVLERRFGALIRHAAIAVGDRADLHAVDQRVRLRLREARRRSLGSAEQRRRGQTCQRELPEFASRIGHLASPIHPERKSAESSRVTLVPPARTRTARRLPRRAVLLSVEQVGLRRVRDHADPGVPQRLALGGVERHEVARAIAGKQQPSGGRQHTGRTSTARQLMAPRDLRGLRIDRGDRAARRHPAPALHAAESHRAPRVRVDQIPDRETVVLRQIEEPGVGRIRRRRPVRRAGADDRAADRRDFFGVEDRPALLVEAAGPVGAGAELAAGDVLAGHAIDGEEVAVPRARRDELARTAVDRPHRRASVSAPSPSRACRAATSGSTTPSCRCRRSRRRASR